MGIVWFLFCLVIVDQFNVKRIRTLKAENNAPVRPNRNRPKPFEIALERIKAVAGQVKFLWGCRVIENGKNFLNCIHEIRAYPATVVAFIKPFEAAMLETPNH